MVLGRAQETQVLACKSIFATAPDLLRNPSTRQLAWISSISDFSPRNVRHRCAGASWHPCSTIPEAARKGFCRIGRCKALPADGLHTRMDGGHHRLRLESLKRGWWLSTLLRIPGQNPVTSWSYRSTVKVFEYHPVCG